MLFLNETPVDPLKENLYQRLMAGATAPVYVLGRNKYAQRAARAVKVTGFVDDFTKEKCYHEKPVFRMSDLPSKCVVISCVMDTLPVTALTRLRAAGVQEIIDYFTLVRLAPSVFGQVEFCGGNRQDILENAMHYRWVHDHLADEVSKRHFAKVVNFRLNLDLKCMAGIQLSINRQYFEKFLPLRARDVFVDGGGYDGQTSLQFAALNNAYERIHYFEPIPSMMEVSRLNLARLRDVNFVEKGLFSRNCRLRFDAEAGTASKLAEGGRSEIDVACIDQEIDEPITLMKLDIEGAEYDAILGAKGHIKSDRPTMAICIYHNQQDFWRIPLQIMEIDDRYDIYVRHYSESVRETVMFFVPM